MKFIERILIKLMIVQLFFLLLAQLFLHEMNLFPELKQITEYEGVGKDNFTEVIETFHGR
ncbi:DUF5359 family protein [Bacillus aquiflavi]|uniref:DUF5359 family protein n=1 Tax=Bacillus aquiflavi TaxID=2672567 RepID=A0A6B3VVW8_9BACI|nr:DUF5359 family protein [Bacillus aquiflavi]MBA4536061.1 DUF5359 family protein [Bacillus aquiflavi]NEY80435.1 YpfB family protein [Bacillus aquiflavi]UAC47091.1 YpfB family protein [Bacillus aquiflavi]